VLPQFPMAAFSKEDRATLTRLLHDARLYLASLGSPNFSAIFVGRMVDREAMRPNG